MSPRTSNMKSRRPDARRSSRGVASSAVGGGGTLMGPPPSRTDPLDAADLLLHREGDSVRVAGLLEPMLGLEGVPVPDEGRDLEGAAGPRTYQSLGDPEGQQLEIGQPE